MSLTHDESTEMKTGAGGVLSDEELDVLRQIPSPTIANVIEPFHVRPRDAGVTDTRIQCLFPEFGAVVGYACTATIHSGQPAPNPRNVDRTAYWKYIKSSAGRRISVVQDLSETPGGAYWGEVNANIHLALGSVGVITNGSVRDLDEVQRLGFHFFASGVQVSHGHAHLEEFNRPVKVFGTLVHPGDLIHADKHGMVVIPHEIAREIPAAVRDLEAREKLMIQTCKSPDAIEELDKLIPHEY
jgi:regulator of RNase E activity RraA